MRKWLCIAFASCLVIWLAAPAWFLLCLAWQYPPFANTVAALGILAVCAGIAFGGGVKLLDWLYKIWAGGGMNRM